MDRKQINILLVEDNEGDYILTREMLRDSPKLGFDFNLIWADSFSKGLECLGESKVDVILFDLSLPDAHGLDGFYSIRAVARNIPILVITGLDDETLALQAVQSGAQDYIVKSDLSGVILVRSVSYAIERFEILRDLENAKEAAERANKAKSELLVNLSHEIHAPIYSVIRMTDLVLGSKLSGEQKEYLQSVKNSAHVLLSLVNNILDFSKIDAGTLDLAPVNFKLRDYVSQVTRLLEERAKQKDLAFLISVHDDIPDNLLGDLDRLGQVLKNFIINAITYARYSGKIEILVDFDGCQDNQIMLHFSVGLRGTDISLEKQKLIFESFAQADVSAARKYGSMGLGLAVSSRLIKLMGGRVWVENDPELGSTFHFTARFIAVTPEAQIAVGG